MAKVDECYVDNCIHNKNGKCTKAGITIDFNVLNYSNPSFCDSYRRR